ncbi:MAG: hypothetical protein Ct9H300mP31_15740 [Acidimicrobiaceae bacterium]|nr:MAG: hypothetical protein Ct9H300mP31_15740 [Acidimicrobiaceae bacterium]
MAIRTRPDTYADIEVDIRTEELAKSSRIVSRLTGYPVQYNKAVVGRNAFAHEAGIHQHGVLNERTTYEIMDPAAVGQGESQLVLGKHSGRAAFRDALQKLGHDIQGDALNAAFTRFKELADRKVSSVMPTWRPWPSRKWAEGRPRLRVLEWTSGRQRQHAVGRLGDRWRRGGLGVLRRRGMVDASCTAIKQATGVEGRMTDYNVTSVTGGVDALADVALTFESNDGVKVSGGGLSTDVVEARHGPLSGPSKNRSDPGVWEDPNAVDRPATSAETARKTADPG